jgi:hypothetical protein
VNNVTQLTLDFEPGLTARHKSLLSVINTCVLTNRDESKQVASRLQMKTDMLLRSTWTSTAICVRSIT